MIILNKEYFLPHKNFPWFKKANVNDVLNVLLEKNKYLNWSALDVDLEIDSLSSLQKYPLIADS